MTLPWLDMESHAFPPTYEALTEPNGLLAIGGDLNPKRIASAYSKGIFPWFTDGEPILWWSPCPRAVIPINKLRINRTLRKALNKTNYNVTINHSFEQVIRYCADAPFRREGTWIVDDMIEAYIQMHKQGIAHSVEVWRDNKLVGGLYGVAINGYFSGESMFYLEPNASKIALVYIAKHLSSQHITFIDCQIINPFLKDMGCIEINRKEFIQLKQKEILKTLPQGFWLARSL